jgi:hypothetical protein
MSNTTTLSVKGSSNKVIVTNVVEFHKALIALWQQTQSISKDVCLFTLSPKSKVVSFLEIETNEELQDYDANTNYFFDQERFIVEIAYSYECEVMYEKHVITKQELEALTKN